MKLLLIGATRGVGFELLQQALQAGHDVTLIARNPELLEINDEHLNVIKGGILDKSVIEQNVNGQDAVCITIGIKPTRKPVSIYSEGTKTVIEAMKKSPCRRLLCVTGIGAGDSRGHGGFFYDKIINPLLLKTGYEDKDRQEAIVRQSGLDWEIIRPGFLTNGARTGKYRILTNLSGVKAGNISRADVADFMLNEVSEMQYVNQTLLLTY
ncbi:NAD(P)-dependent oxidoreductase [Nodosilinea nodulosa]|uniref:NAD(P)-dependent oxidoreductase n=1 Tax=Nodosilinea nodulosa TaxID=416001 RepID=UPI0002FEB7CE|nr:SDR family oxidoreductase [Nodosilinea nodulosa]